MRVLVAGWHGQVAVALSEAAARRDDVTAYAVGRPALDLTDRPTVGRTLFGIAPDVIINTAAYTDVDGAEREPEIAQRRNVEGAAALARQAASIGVPIIHLSTVYVFDGAKSAPYIETDVTSPMNAYGKSKRDGEFAVATANPRHLILRTGWVYSPFGRNFVSSILDRAQAQAPLTIDDRQRGSPTYAPHLADAILAIAARITAAPRAQDWGVYHIADQGHATWCDIGRTALAARASPNTAAPEIVVGTQTPDRTGAARPANAMLDCARLEERFETRLPPWNDAVRDCVQRLQED